MRLDERMYSGVDTRKVIEYASHPEWHLDKAHAMYELASRALEDDSLLGEAWRCIGGEVVFVNRQGPPLGHPAAALLLDANREAVEKALVESMRGWSSHQQADFFLGVVCKAQRRAFLDRLVSNYGFSPKFDVDADGAVIYE